MLNIVNCEKIICLYQNYFIDKSDKLPHFLFYNRDLLRAVESSIFATISKKIYNY